VSLRWKYTIVVNAALAATAACFVLAHRLGYWPQDGVAFTAAVAVGACALALVIGIAYRQFVARPLLVILDVTGQLAEGTTGRRIRVAHGDEFAAIADAVNELADQEERRRDEMQRRYLDTSHGLRSALVDVQQRSQRQDDMRGRIAAADREKAEFLTNVSHELRTPLISIHGFLKLLEEGLYDDAEEQQEFFEHARFAAEHMLSVLDGKLAAARLDRDALQPVLQPVETGPLATSVARVLEATRRTADVELRVEACGTAMADPSLLRQVLFNLLGNAIKFTDSGSIILRIRQDEETIRFEVQDTGDGIESTDVERIFEPFERVDSASSRATGGTGLGLSLSRRLVELMGGELGVISEGKGCGSRFYFALPVAQASTLTA
jgi:signal transduction histidine kinase